MKAIRHKRLHSLWFLLYDNPGRENYRNRNVSRFSQEWERWSVGKGTDYRRTWGNIAGVRIILHLDCGRVYVIVYIYQNTYNCKAATRTTAKMMDCTIWTLHINKHIIKTEETAHISRFMVWFGLNQELFEVLGAK